MSDFKWPTSHFPLRYSAAVHSVRDWQWHGIGAPVFRHGKFTKWRFTAQQHTVKKARTLNSIPVCPSISLPVVRVYQKRNLPCCSTEVFFVRVQHRLQLSVNILVKLPSELCMRIYLWWIRKCFVCRIYAQMIHALCWYTMNCLN